LGAGTVQEAFVDRLFSAGEKMEDDPFCSGWKTFIEEDYHNYEGSNGILLILDLLVEVMSSLLRLRRTM